MTEETPVLVGTDGRELKTRPKSTACPKCGAPKEKRINTAGFGRPVICCGACGLEFPGETEP